MAAGKPNRSRCPLVPSNGCFSVLCKSTNQHLMSYRMHLQQEVSSRVSPAPEGGMPGANTQTAPGVNTQMTAPLTTQGPRPATQAPAAATQFDELLAAEQLHHMHAGGAAAAAAAGKENGAAGATGAAAAPRAASPATPPAAVALATPHSSPGGGGDAVPATGATPAATPLGETPAQQQQHQQHQQQLHQQPPQQAGASVPGADALCSWVSPTQQEQARRCVDLRCPEHSWYLLHTCSDTVAVGQMLARLRLSTIAYIIMGIGVQDTHVFCLPPTLFLQPTWCRRRQDSGSNSAARHGGAPHGSEVEVTKRGSQPGGVAAAAAGVVRAVTGSGGGANGQDVDLPAGRAATPQQPASPQNPDPALLDSADPDQLPRRETRAAAAGGGVSSAAAAGPAATDGAEAADMPDMPDPEDPAPPDGRPPKVCFL